MVSIGWRWLDVLAPRRCAACGSGGLALCQRCRQEIVRLPRPRARFHEGTVIAGAFEYQHPVNRVLHRSKYRDHRSALVELAGLAADRLCDRWCATSELLVVPVPLGRRRLRQRGYNQASLIAGAFARRLSLPLCTTLARVRNTPPQVTERSGVSRQENVTGAFAWCGAPIDGLRVVLVDDVVTTGATVVGAARAVREAGAAGVDVAAVALVRRPAGGYHLVEGDAG